MYLAVKQFFLCAFVILLNNINQDLNAQIVYTQHFTDELLGAHIDYYKPLEEWYHVRPKRRDRFLKYDLVIQNQDGDREMRFIIDPYMDDALDQFPHIEMTRIVSQMATNHPEAEIRAVVLNHDFAKERFNADWGMIQYFEPKRQFARFAYGTLISLYAKGKSTIHAIILSKEEEYDAMKDFHQVQFRE